jgi:hypothetical protein
VKGMFGFDEWREFVDRNREALKRYFRDQCVLAKRYFCESIDEGLFQMAVEYCLENKTYAMTALKDTYEHQKREHEKEHEMIFQAFGKALGTGKKAAPVVSKRPIGDYESVAAARAAERSR